MLPLAAKTGWPSLRRYPVERPDPELVRSRMNRSSAISQERQRRRIQPDRPHVRLGLAWAAALGAGALLGPWGLAIVLIPAAALAAIEASRIHRLPAPYQLGLAAAAAVTVAAGLLGAVPILALSAAVELLTAVLLFRNREHPERVRRWAGTMVAVAVTLGPATVVALATRSVTATVVLLVALCLYDAAAYVVGTGAGNNWEGPAAGAVSLVPLVVIVASVLDPPFRNGSGWIMGAAAVLLLPLGYALSESVVGRRRVPATRRLDALMLTGPVWLVLAALLNVH